MGSVTGSLDWMRTEASASGADLWGVLRTDRAETRVSPYSTSACIHSAAMSSPGLNRACTRTSSGRPITAAPLCLPNVTAELLKAVDSKIQAVQIWRTSETLHFFVGTFCHSLSRFRLK